jgi:uncharacterized membrane protein YqaE (UPF0057 family)
LNGSVLLFAFLALMMVFLTVLYQVGMDIMVNIVFGILLWIPLTLMFILNQVGMTRIISRAKIKKLSEIETEISNLEST